MFGISETEKPAGMRALVRCAECDTPLAGVDTVGDQASIETEIDECSNHPNASYILSVERL